MNERIKELIEQAGITTNIDTNHFEKDPNKWVDYFAEKFAELIVRECAEWLKQPVNQTPSCGTVMNITAERLKEHFGIIEPKGWVCPKCRADRTKIPCPLGFGAQVDGRCPMTVEAQ